MESIETTNQEEIELEKKLDEQREFIKNKAKQLSDKYKKTIDYHCFTEYEGKGADAKATGKMFAAFTQQPHAIATAKAMDMFISKQFHQSGMILFNAVVLQGENETDKEVLANDKYRVGLAGLIGVDLDVQAPDVKKS